MPGNVDHQLLKVSGVGYHIEVPKTKSGVRQIPMSTKVCEAFRRVLQERKRTTPLAEFFGVTEYEIRKAVKLAQLIPPLAEIVENETKKLNLACADLIADYDAATQTAFIEMCQIEGYALNKQTVTFIQTRCPPPAADQQAVYAAWREARAKETQRAAAPPKKLSFDRKRFAPYLSKFKSDKEIEELFLDFLRQRAG